MILQEYVLKQCDIWFIRSDVCPHLGLAAAGSNTGKIQIYSVGSISSRTQEVVPVVSESSPNKVTLYVSINFLECYLRWLTHTPSGL